MADDGSAQDANAWPMPKFSFRVQWGSRTLFFQEVSGLDVEVQPIEYRHGDSRQFSTVKMPGLKKSSNVTMKKGVFVNDSALWNWMNQIHTGAAQRSTVTISLLDESGAPTMVWTLTNAWPTKITGTDLKSEGNEVAVETLELAFESLSVAAQAP